ncbi:STAS domain-containing protein [Aliikangiella coralliicola]|uniref:STAS domain-containing protein n=1 Tax=Aliikangiella coralliicola TaxID=2592383 RepID=A0A545U0A9_9GAMM|nr:STAS domain-containing protein [Aliikangiella coralliicola]TQV82900.1 STAS domain-containing protein [Aliikangiella coralliicola]
MDGAILAARVDDIEYIKFRGTVRYSHCAGLEAHIDSLFDVKDFSEVVIDLENADILDSTALGLLARIAIELRKYSERLPVIFVKKGELFNILKRVCFDQVFNIFVDDFSPLKGEYRELENTPQNEQQILKRVIEAHRSLASIDDQNEKFYKDITSALK